MGLLGIAIVIREFVLAICGMPLELLARGFRSTSRPSYARYHAPTSETTLSPYCQRRSL